MRLAAVRPSVVCRVEQRDDITTVVSVHLRLCWCLRVFVGLSGKTTTKTSSSTSSWQLSTAKTGLQRRGWQLVGRLCIHHRKFPRIASLTVVMISAIVAARCR